MTPFSRNRGVSLISVLVALFLAAVIVAILLPALGAARRTARSMSNNVQTRGIQQGMVTFAQSNKIGSNDGYFPGMDSSGNLLSDSDQTGHSGNGSMPGARLWIMLEGNFFTAEYLICPADERAVEAQRDSTSQLFLPLKPQNYSYALASIAGTENEKKEWSETLNGQAIPISARAIGSGRDDISSDWTTKNSGLWKGTVTRNDNSTSFETHQDLAETQYGEGEGEINPIDDLFADDPNADDAFLVHQDATTSYSVE